MAGVTTEHLLERYRLRRSKKVLDQVVERHRALVESMALNLASRLPRSVDAQDLVHAGMWGLMQAIASYEPERCDSFLAFMRIRVRGAMLDELRHMDFLPRLFRRRVRERDQARARLRMQLEREPTDTELADELGITEEALLRCPESKVLRSVHFREGDSDEDQFDYLEDDAVESPIEAITRQELLELVRKHLNPIEWKVLKLHYLDGLTTFRVGDGYESLSNGKAAGSPMTFLQAAAFQWVNPKAWAMCLSVAAQFVSGVNLVAEAAIVAAVSATVGPAAMAACDRPATAAKSMLTKRTQLDTV